jgi:hypothetical protein
MSDETKLVTSPADLLDSAREVAEEAGKAPLPGGSAAPSDDKESEKAEGKEKAA